MQFLDIDHVSFGLHSNIPECCVDFWNTEWQQMDNSQRKEWQHSYNKTSYIVCPDCIRSGYRQEIHDCNANCMEYLITVVKLPASNIFRIILSNLLNGRIKLPRPVMTRSGV